MDQEFMKEKPVMPLGDLHGAADDIFHVSECII